MGARLQRCRQATVATVLGGILAAGCGHDDATTDGSGGGHGTDLGSGGDERAYVELPKRSGTVTIFESHVEGVRQTNLIGAFLDIEDGYPGACVDEEFGACVVTFCKSGSVSRDALVDAGSLSIAFGEAEELVTQRNGATGFYLATRVDAELLATGVDVVISTTGNVVPSFTTAVRSPPLARLTSALPPEGGTLSAKEPFDLAWTADEAYGELAFVLRAFSRNANRTLTCSFDVAAGAGQVPADAIAAVAALPATETVALEVETQTRAVVTAADFDISVALVVTALSGEADGQRAMAGIEP